MQILSLELDNVKSYTKACIDFTGGTNAIVGQNGAGKSTILEAIGFALFDSIAYRQDDFVREGQKSATITVTFVSSEDERVYQVVRRCGSVSGYYVQDPETGLRICEGKADVVSFLKQHLGVEAGADLTHVFEEAVGVPQGKLTAIFLSSASQRKGVFDKLLQVEEYTTAATKLRDPQRYLRDRMQELDVSIAGLSARLERLPGIEKSILERTDHIHAAQQEATTLHTQLVEVEAQRIQQEAIRQQLSELQTHHKGLTQEVTALTRELDAAQNAQAEAEKASVIVSQNRTGYDAYLAAQAARQTLEKRQRARAQLERQHTDLEKSLVVQRTEVAATQTRLDEAIAAQAAADLLTAAVSEQTELEQALAGVQQKVARLDDARRIVAQYRARLTDLNARRLQLSARLAQSSELEQEQTDTNQSIVAIRAALDEQRQALATCKAEGDAIKQQSSALTSVAIAICPVCEQPLPPAARDELIARNEVKLADLRIAFRTFQQEIKQQENELAAHQKAVEQLQQKIRQLPRAEEITQIEAEIQANQDALRGAEADLAELATAPTQEQALRTELGALENPRQRQAVLLESARHRARLEQQITQLLDAIRTRAQDLVQIQSELDQFADLDSALATSTQTMRAHEAAYQAVLTNQQSAQALDSRRTAATNLATRLAETTDERDTIGAKLAEVEVQFRADAYTALMNREQHLRSQQAGLQTQLSMLDKEQARELAEREALRTQQSEMAAQEKQRALLQSQDEFLTIVRDLLRQAGPFITRALVRQISHGASQFFGDIMQDYTRHLAWNEEYGITLEVDGRERQFAQLSGGEQMSAALAVRLALLREMSNIDVAFFDEPTTNLDEARRASLARQILDVKGFQQLFVISHDDTFEQATQNIIRVTRQGSASAIGDS